MMYNTIMQIGVSTATYFTRKYTEEALVPIAKLGAKVCEIFFATHSEYTEEFANIVNKELIKAQEFSPLKVHSVHALTNQFEPELFSLNDRSYNDAMNTFKKVCRVAEIVGAKNYTFHGATMLKKTTYNFNYPHISERVNILCETARQYGVQFCYENVHWAYFCTPEYFDKLKDICPDLGCVLDIKQAMQSGIPYEEYLKVMNGRLKTVHLCDFNEDRKLAIPGRGTFDFITLFKRLLDSGFDGPCMMELYAKDYKDDKDLQESYDYLLDCFDRALN